MRIVLDACIPARLAAWFPELDVRTVRQAIGTADLDDGPLLEALDGRCDLFVTVDKGIAFQQRTAHLSYAIVLLRGRSNRLEHLIPLASRVMAGLMEFKAGEVHWVGV
ncbi:MAG: hypothetical protein ABR551_08170 [Gemmatimonadales bacterium]